VKTPPKPTFSPKRLFLQTDDAKKAVDLAASDSFHRTLAAAYAHWSASRINDPATHFRQDAVKEFIATLLTIGEPTPPPANRTDGQLEPQ
jgi:hypothetical protein